MKLLILISLLLYVNTSVAAPRVVVADQIKSSSLARTYGFPSITDTLVGLADAQTLTNKTIDGANNTLTVRAASDVTGTLPAANGGTGLSSVGTSGNILTSNGTAWISSAPASAPPIVLPVTRTFTSSGTFFRSHYVVVSNVNATIGATYTINGYSFIVARTITSGSNDTALVLHATSVNSPDPGGGGGTLTKSAGVGDTTIAFTATVPAKYVIVTAVGGGGGGGGAGASYTNGGNGSNTTFGTSLITAALGGRWWC